MTITVEPGQIVEDISIWPTVASLASCLCAEVAAAGLPPLCMCGPLPGETIAADYVTPEAGMAWVRVVSGYPSSAFPGQDTRAGCAAPLAFELELGVLFCAPGLQADGEPPTMADQFEATRVQLAAMAAMRRAFTCCFTASNRDVVLGVYMPAGPEGNVVGGTWQAWVMERVI